MNFSDLSKGALFLAAGKFFELLTVVVTIPLLIQRSGLENYGHYVFANALVLLFLNFTHYSFSIEGVRIVAAHKNEKVKQREAVNHILNAQLFLKLISVSIIFFISWIPFFQEVRYALLFLSFKLLTDFFFPSWLFTSIGRFFPLLLNSIVYNIGLCIYAIWGLKDNISFLEIAIADTLIFSLSSMCFGILYARPSITRFRLTEILKLLRATRVSFYNVFIPLTQTTVLVFLLGIAGDAVTVGVAQVVLKVAALFVTPLVILNTVVFTRLANDENRRLELMKALFWAGLSLSVLIFLIGSFSYFKNDCNFFLKNIKASALFFSMSIYPILYAMALIYGQCGLLIKKADKRYFISLFTTTVVGYLFVIFCGRVMGHWVVIVALLVTKLLQVLLYRIDFLKVR